MFIERVRAWVRRFPRWMWIVIGAALLVMLLLLWILLRLPTVELVSVTRGQVISAVYAPGTVLSGTETVIASTAAGRIVGLNIQRGSRVVPGQIVAQIDDRQARLQVEQARRELETAQAQLARVEEPGDPYAIQQARAQLAQAQSEYRRALDTVTASQAQLRSSRDQVEQTQAGVDAAQARVETARRNVRSLREQRNTASEQVDVAQAQANRAEVILTDARDALRRQQSLYEQGAVAERRVVEARTAVQAAEADLAQRRADVRVAQQQVGQTEAGVEAGLAQVDEAESGVAQARAAVSQAQNAVNAAEANVAEAQAAAAAVRQQITAAQAQLAQTQRGERSSAVAVAEAQVRAAQAQVDLAQENLANYTIRSLVTGTVNQVPVEVGDSVPVGGTIANVVSPRQLYVEADVDEADIAPVAIGQTAYFTSDSEPGRTYQGVVTEIAASADEETNTYPVEIRNIDDTTGLRVNMSVDVNIVTRTNRFALLVPSSAVVLDPTPHVWVVDARSRLQSRNVVLGVRDQNTGRTEIRSGLLSGEQVVRSPLPTFRNGQRVRVRRVITSYRTQNALAEVPPVTGTEGTSRRRYTMIRVKNLTAPPARRAGGRASADRRP